MPVIIDGYNLLHATMPPVLAGLDEARLCRLLVRGPWGRGPHIVVCDGKPKAHAPASPVADVELLYSGPSRTADDVIADLVQESSAPRQLVVVSSDREVQKSARRRRCVVLSSAQFVRELSAVASQPDAGRDIEAHPDRLTDEETRRWMKLMDLEHPHDPDDPDRPWWSIDLEDELDERDERA